MRCESCIYYNSEKNICEARSIPLRDINAEKCLLYTRPEGFKMTLYEVLLADGTSSIIIDESPYDLKAEWVGVQTYKQIFHYGGYHYEQADLFNIRPSMIVGFWLLKDCEVIM